MIDEFVENIRRTGIFTSNKYLMEITFPTNVRNQIRQQTGINVDSGLSFRISRTTLPGDVIKLEARPSQSRNKLSIATDREDPTPISFAMILSEDLRERQFFEIWMEYIYGKDDRSFQPKFLDMYTAPLARLYIGDRSRNNFKLRYDFKNVYPTQIAQTELSTDQGDVLGLSQITMMYETWERFPLSRS